MAKRNALAGGLAVAAAIIAGVGAESACAGDGTAAAAIAAVQGRTVIAAVPRHWPPQYAVDRNGRPIGFAIDVMDEIARRAGITVQYKVFPHFSAVSAAMRRGEADLIPNSGITSDRSSGYLFTSPLETFVVSIFTRSDAEDIGALDDLVGRRVGVVRNNVGENILISRPDIKMSVYPQARDALFELLAGRDDALVFPRPVLLSLARRIGVDARIKVVGPPLRELKRAIRVQPSQPELAATLDAVVKSFVRTRDYQRIYLKWYGDERSPRSADGIVWTMSALLIIAFIVMGGWRYVTVVRLSRELAATMSAREATAQALRGSEERFRDFAGAASDWFWEMGPDLRFTYHSVRYFEITGFRPRDKIGTERTRYVDPASKANDRAHWERHLGDLAARRPFKNFEYAFRTAKGDILHVRISGVPVFDADGAFAGYRGTGTDINEAKLAEEALRKSERELSEALRIGEIGYWRWVLDPPAFEGSDQFRQIYSFDPREPLTYDKAIAAIHEDDIDWMNDMRDAAIANPRPEDVAFRIRRPDGEVRHIEARRLPETDVDGRVRGFFGIARDVTDRVRTQAALTEAEIARDRLVSAFDRFPEAILLLDSSDRVIFANAQFRSRFAALFEDGLVDISFEQLLRMGAAQGFVPEAEGREEIWLRERLRQHAAKSGPQRVRRVHDGELWFDQYDYATPDGGSLLMFVDVTDSVQRDQQLTQMQKMDAVGQLTGGIAHDFNNLLMVIHGNLALLEEQLEDDSVCRALITPALNAVERGASLTNRLLAFARRQPLRASRVDISELIEGMSDMLRRSIGEQIDVRVAMADDLWPCDVDQGQLEQTIVNLAINARDAMPHGGILTIAARNETLDAAAASTLRIAAGDYVAIAVSDLGVGMDETVRQRAFEPFYTTKDVGKGTGLGLSMVYGFVTQSGGSATIDSEVGAGATVILHLPRASPLDDTIEGTVQAACLPARGEKVLVVEDDTDLRHLVVTQLRSLGYSVHQAKDGASAQSVLENGRDLDLLLTDVILPGGFSGPDIAARARRLKPRIKVLYMSGYTQDAVLDDADGAPGELLLKPFDTATLGRIIARVMAA